jgi:hypothetical protein
LGRAVLARCCWTRDVGVNWVHVLNVSGVIDVEAAGIKRKVDCQDSTPYHNFTPPTYPLHLPLYNTKMSLLSKKHNCEEKGKELADEVEELKDGEINLDKEHPTKCSKADFVGMALHDIDKYRTVYFEGVDASQVNEVLDNLKGIDVWYEVGQVMHDSFTKVMSVVLLAEDVDLVTKARELVEQCYGGPGWFCPEWAYDEKEVTWVAMAICVVKSEGDHVISNSDFVKAVKELMGWDMLEDFEMV